MTRQHNFLNFAIALALILGIAPCRTPWLLGQSTDDCQCSPKPTSVVASPATHSPPILTPPTNLFGMWSQLASQEKERGYPTGYARDARVHQRLLPLPGMALPTGSTHSMSAPAVIVPISDETEKAIAEVRSRLGNAGSRFSDLISPEDEARLFAEALSQVRQEQQLPAAPHAPPATNLPPAQAPVPPPAPTALPLPVLPHYPSSQAPTQPTLLPTIPPAATPAHPPGGYSTHPQLHWAPGQPNPPAHPNMAMPNGFVPAPHNQMPPAAHTPAQGGWNHSGNQPGQPRFPQPLQPQAAGPRQETEQAAMRRIAREVDALAEQLENIKHYSEADSLRRSAQQFREAVR